MIKNYNQFNESLLDKLEGPSKEDVLNNITPDELLYRSCKKSDYENAKFALENNADVHYLKDLCIRFSDDFEIIRLLVEYGANIQADNNVALYNSIIRKDYRRFKFLLENGANIEDHILSYLFSKNRKKFKDYLINNNYIKWNELNSDLKRYAEIYLTEEQVEKIKNNY